MTSQELSDAWNELRNAALGRGTSPRVSPALARVVAREYEKWRRELHASPWKGDDPPPWVWEQVATYRKVFAKVKAEGKAPKKELPQTPLERVGRGLETLARNFAIGLGVFGGAYIIFALVRGTRGS